jgi:hypothetical protein
MLGPGVAPGADDTDADGFQGHGFSLLLEFGSLASAARRGGRWPLAAGCREGHTRDRCDVK